MYPKFPSLMATIDWTYHPGFENVNGGKDAEAIYQDIGKEKINILGHALGGEMIVQVAGLCLQQR